MLLLLLNLRLLYQAGWPTWITIVSLAQLDGGFHLCDDSRVHRADT